MSITLELPDVVKEQIGESPEALTRALLEKAAVDGYRAGRLSRVQVRALLGLSWYDNEEFLAKNGCFVITRWEIESGSKSPLSIL